ncbi:hypothetical protein M0802_007097 [Mischocyttarus mexicanus]|nr:hypothetical protein M0802_007097 [Mischocyttarus mexicanus]
MPPVKLGLSGIYSKAGRFFACRELCPVQALRGGTRNDLYVIQSVENFVAKLRKRYATSTTTITTTTTTTTTTIIAASAAAVD